MVGVEGKNVISLNCVLRAKEATEMFKLGLEMLSFMSLIRLLWGADSRRAMVELGGRPVKRLLAMT